MRGKYSTGLARLATAVQQWQRNGMRKVAFLHVPNTAGTTLYKVIEANMGPIALYPARSSPEVHERFGNNFVDFLAKVEAANGSERDALLADFRAHPAVGGHIGSAIFPYLDDAHFVFTSLREPGDRLVSWYFHYVHPDNPEKCSARSGNRPRG